MSEISISLSPANDWWLGEAEVCPFYQLQALGAGWCRPGFLLLITTEAKGPLHGHETNTQRGRRGIRRRLPSSRLRQCPGGAVVVQPGRAGLGKPDGGRFTQPKRHAVRRPSLPIHVSRPMSDVRTSARSLCGRHRPGSDASGVRRDDRRRRARD
jgi:hypothetical protein